MPNIEIHGYADMSDKIKQRIDKCMQNVGLGNEAITTKFLSVAESCDGKSSNSPYLRIFSSEFSHIPVILAGFQKHAIYHEIEVISAGKTLFFKGAEITSGDWNKKI